MRLQNVCLFATLLCAGFVSAQTPYQPPTVPTTHILAMGHLTVGTSRADIAPVMKDEVPATLRLYLDGKIDQWYYRNDGEGVVFVMNCTTVEEAHAILEKLPLGQHKMMEFDLIPLGPLAPLGRLLGAAPAATGK
jgi:hypothetical protein